MAGCRSAASLQKMLQTAVESIRWTYGHFWTFCSQQGILMWCDGYYNGPIKTTKTIQPSPELRPEEASLQRSHQLKELYKSLSNGEAAQAAKRPCTTALLPEDLNELEWFYLISISFSFPPDVGMLGKAFACQKSIWLTEANRTESKLFPRAILAQSANIQTIVWIPLGDGVLEMGTTNKVEEDKELTKKVTMIFMDYVHQYHHHQAKPVHYENFNQNSTDSDPNYFFHSSPLSMMLLAAVETLGSEHELDDDEQNDGNVDGKADIYCESEIESSMQRPIVNELMRSDIFSTHFPNDMGFGNVDFVQRITADDHLQVQPQHSNSYCEPWLLPDEISSAEAQSSESTSLHCCPSQQHAKYTETVTSILQQTPSCWVKSLSMMDLHSTESAFSKLEYMGEFDLSKQSSRTESQKMLKKLLTNVRFLYKENVNFVLHSKFNKGMSSQDETSLSHVLAERRRRERLNDRFTTLRSLIPFVTKMDKASILGDTIEYVKQLRARIHDLESRSKDTGTEGQARTVGKPSEGNRRKRRALRTGYLSCQELSDAEANMSDQSREVPTGTRKMKNQEKGSTNSERRKMGVETVLEVSIIDSDALLELQCAFKEGLLLAVMKALHFLRLKVTSVQSSSTDGIFNAKLRAKVEENNHGRRANLVEVKAMINKVLVNL